MNETQDHHETHMTRNKPQEGGMEVQMEPVDPVIGPPEKLVVDELDPVVRRSTRIARPSTRYPVAEFDLT